jgi:predicted amidophosphoribosyltransferase
MKTSAQDAHPKPGRECSTCGTPLLRHEYELCDQCRAELMDDYNDAKRPGPPEDEREGW